MTFPYGFDCFLVGVSLNTQPKSTLNSFDSMIKLDFLFDQGRLINLSTMLNLKSLWKYDGSQIIPRPKHTCVEHGRITKIHPTEVKALKGELEIQNIYYNNNYYYLKKIDYEAKF